MDKEPGNFRERSLSRSNARSYKVCPGATNILSLPLLSILDLRRQATISTMTT